MILIAHQNKAHAYESAHQLQGLGARARRLLEECVEQQIITKSKISKSTDLLEQAEFLFVRNTGNQLSPEYTLRPTLLGEEALEALEALELLANANQP